MNDAWTPLEDFITSEMERPYKLMRMRMMAFAAQGIEPLVKFLFEQEAECRSRIDAYCVVRSQGKPHCDPADPVDEYWFRQRLLCVGDTVGIVYGSPLRKKRLLPSPPRTWTQAEVLEWSLVSLWHRRFDHWIKLTAVTQVTGLPFYGLQDAE